MTEMTREVATDEVLQQEGDRLYERYGKPLESEHWGEYVMITRDGRTLVASTLTDAFVQGSKAFGSGHFLFRVGQRAAVTLR